MSGSGRSSGDHSLANEHPPMLFNSFAFAWLVIFTAGIFYFPPFRRVQTYVLIAASLFFYAYGQPALVLLLIISISINAIASFQVLQSSRPSDRKFWAITGVALNLAVLFFFKYGPLFIRTFDLETARSGSIGHVLVTIPLPVGISFFTFQGISLVVDVFRQKEGDPHGIAQKNFWAHFRDTAFFKAFFPQLVAGPIVKAHDFYPQIGPKRFHDINWDGVFRALVTGYFLKMVVADNLKDLTYWMAYPYFINTSTATLVTLLFGYSMQIFADFAGYSLIAIGTARIFGYELMENFNFPYIAQSLSEFWRRWHISLSTWLREYLYIPLGGNRRGPVRTYLNLLLVMVLGGLWHGAAWSYAIWGFFHGCGLAVERFCQRERSAETQPSFSFLRAAAVFTFVTFGWLLFKLPDISHVAAFLRAVVENFRTPADPRITAYVLFYSTPVIIYHALHLRRRKVGLSLAPRWQPLAYGTALCALLVNSGSPGAFIYFQF